ncbi:claudin-10 [Betta splendens]|uniref:Claudin-10 n=1 Tax=Betta splendens TaxID=158456 RepID=A0A6P7LWE1_BETSP|nr:claudin-10 [Betta splendens]
MQIRVVQIWGFLMTVLGWVFVACTIAMDGWMSSSIGDMGGSYIIKSIGYWYSLWKTCRTDAADINKCYDLPGLWSADVHLQVVRGLLVAALSLGMLGFLLSLLGMECTVIGGKDRSKSGKIYTGGICHIISGLLSTCSYAVYVNYVLIYFNPDPFGMEYEVGNPVFIGWVGSASQMTGGCFYLWSVCTSLCGEHDKGIKVQPLVDPEQAKSPLVPESTSRPPTSSVSESSIKSLSSIPLRSERSHKTGQTAQSGYQRTRPASGSSRSKSASWSDSESSRYSQSASSRSSGSSRSSSRTGSSLS